MCELCVDGKDAEALVRRLTRDGVIRTAEEEQRLRVAREQCETFQAHKATVVEQRKLFNSHVRSSSGVVHCMRNVAPQRDELQPGEVILIPDFKEKITLGNSLVEKQRKFYDRSFRALFAIVALFRTEAGGRLHKHVFNFLSRDLSNDAQFVTQCFREVRMHACRSAWCLPALLVSLHSWCARRCGKARSGTNALSN